MSIDSVNQTAASAYTAQPTGAIPVDKIKIGGIQAQKRLIDVVELSDAAKAFLAKGDNAKEYNFMGKLDLSGIPQLSEEDARSIYGGYTSLTEMIAGQFGFDSVEEWRADMKIKREYSQAKNDFMTSNSKESQAINGKLLAASGGLLYGTSYEPEDLSKPVITTSGRIHPRSDEIRSFLLAHKADIDQMQQIRSRQFLSFEEWSDNRPA